MKLTHLEIKSFLSMSTSVCPRMKFWYLGLYKVLQPIIICNQTNRSSSLQIFQINTTYKCFISQLSFQINSSCSEWIIPVDIQCQFVAFCSDRSNVKSKRNSGLICVSTWQINKDFRIFLSLNNLVDGLLNGASLCMCSSWLSYLAIRRNGRFKIVIHLAQHH